MRIACVQLRAREVGEADRALEEALDAADQAAREADLVVLPEATYPGYVLHDGLSFGRSAYDRAREALGEVARRHGAWIAVGLVRPVEGGLANSAVLLGPDGNVAAIADKTFLWHFDSQWFRSGTPGEVIALPWGQIGMFVCADARMTEIPRRLAVRGARLLLDPTALVLSPLGTNSQLEYMLSARAWENGAFLAVANKCGSEAGIARYGGRSAIFDPSGDSDVIASPKYAASYENPGGQKWERQYVDEGLSEGGSQELMQCAVAYIKDIVEYGGSPTGDRFWAPPLAVMFQAGQECS